MTVSGEPSGPASPPPGGAGESVQILGVRIDLLTEADLEARVAAAIARGERRRLTYANAHVVNLASEDAFMRQFLAETDWVYCDGHGLALCGSLLGLELGEPLTAAAWLPAWGRRHAGEPLRLFLLGSDSRSLAGAAQALEQCPGFSVVGTHDGYFDARDGSADNSEIVKTINAASPEILLVGMGSPRQEQWVEAHWPMLQTPIVFPVGAAFDYLAGTLSRPPSWMIEGGLEWLSRLFAEPRRLWRRYLLGIPVFLARILREAVRTA